MRIPSTSLRKPRLFSGLVVAVIVGFGGAYMMFSAKAATTNPPFAYTCGFNVMFQIDNSTSRSPEKVNVDKQHIKAFMDAFNGTDTYFLLSLSGPGVMVPYTSDKSKVVGFLDRSPGGDGGAVVIGGSDDIDLNVLTPHASYRPSKQTIIMIFTDGGDPNKYENEYKEPSSQLKASGARIIGFILPGQKGSFSEVQKMTGPNVDTGNILTSDVVHNSDYAALTSQLKQFAGIDSCNPPQPVNSNSPRNGSGSNGTNGTGTGPTGSGTGGGSSGSTATKNGNDPNSTPSSSNQGNKDQTKLDPSPFYDGKQYQRGSESDSGLGGLFNKPASGGIAKGWYLLTALTLLAGGGGIWYYQQKAHRK